MAETAANPEVTMREIKELITQFNESGWASLELEIGSTRLVLNRNGSPIAGRPEPARAVPAPAPAPAATVVAPAPQPQPLAAAPKRPARTANAIEVRSPVVGAFWLSPSPGEAPFVEIGQHIEEGQQLGIVEVMKLMNHVSAPAAGTLVEVCAANSDMVEYEQVLFIIEPAR